jgi:ABC-type multidrug transport system ATPase subunit
MIRHLGSSLTDVTYVFDEPTIGMHPHDIQRMNGLLLRLRDKGNTVLVVEHKPEAIAIADHVVDLGPGAGTGGGSVVFEGTVEGLRASSTLTGRHLDDRASLKPSVRTPSRVLEVRGASTHNLRDVDVDIPLGVLVVVTGVAGSGKSSLIHGSVSGRDGVVPVDQAAIRGSRRSNPATYTGLLDPIRKAFAKANGVKPALFSPNSEGACPNCNGAGVIYTDLAMMAGVATTCEECEGKRFEASVLEHHLGGRDISEVLAMPVTEAEEFFGGGEARTPAAYTILGRLADVGLGYLKLGQPLTTLSGGERQRLKLATRMAEKGGVYVLDEPTSGLHLADVEQLLGLLDRLVDSGKSVIVIEHHQAVMAHADWIIDLGPGAGHDGGRVVFEGTPADLVAARSTLTGEHLAAYVDRSGIEKRRSPSRSYRDRHGHHHSRELPPARRPGRRPGLLPRHPRLRGPQRRRLQGHALAHGRPPRPARHVDRPAPTGRRPRHHRRGAPHHRRDDGQGHLRRHPPGHRRPRRYLRAAASERRRGRPGADRAALRGSRLRRPRSRGQPAPHPGAALSRPEGWGGQAPSWVERSLSCISQAWSRVW